MKYDGLVLVTGASGNLGRRVLRVLEGYGIETRALVRTVVKGDAIQRPGVTMCVGDMKVSYDMSRAVQGARAIISTAGVAVGRGQDTPLSVDFQGNLNLINASVAAGVEHFVLISAIGANWIHTSDVFAAKNKAEQELRASGLRYTILRAAGMMRDYRQAWEWYGQRGIYPAIGPAGKRLAFISPDDLAELAVRSLWTRAAFNQTFDVANSETTIDAEEMAATLSELFARPVRVRRLPVWPFKALRVALEPLSPRIADFMGFLEAAGSHEFSGEGRRIESIYDYRLESYASFLRRTKSQETDGTALVKEATGAEEMSE